MRTKFLRSVRAVSTGAALFLICVAAAEAQQRADNTYIESATAWQQASGEQRALSYQTFAFARLLLDRDLHNRRIRMRRAIIVDVDETILDNSRYQVMLIKKEVNDHEGWTEWCNRAEAKAMPGAVEFLRDVRLRCVRVM